MENRHPVADQKRVKFQFEELAHALPEARRIVHHLVAQQPAMSRRIADHCVADDQD